MLRRWLAVLLVAAFTGTLGGLPHAQAEDVASAQARVDRLQGVVAQTTKTLTEGTRQWQRDKAALAEVTQQLEQTRARMRAVQQVADDTTAQLRDLARRLYMTPSPSHLEIAMVDGPEEFMGALQSLGALDMVADTRGEIVRRATVAREQLEKEQAKVDALVKRASALTKSSEQRMRSLQSLAQSTAAQLSAAQRALVEAREAEAARIAAAEKEAAERLARAQQAREQARARVAAVRFVALCAGLPIEGQQNGFLDPGSLCPLWQAPGMSLKATAAAAFNQMSKYHFETVGLPLCVTGGYRTYQRQVELYAEKPGLAAVPGTSEHGWGNAVDLCGGVEISGTAAHRWMQVHAADFGWFHPSWAQPHGSRPEPWHWEFSG